jgi:hypothetical protein
MQSVQRALYPVAFASTAMVLLSACAFGQTPVGTTPSSSPGLQRGTAAHGRFTVLYRADAIAYARSGQRDLVQIVESSLEHIDTLLPGPRATLLIYVCKAPIVETGTCESTAATGVLSQAGFAATSQTTAQQALDIWLPRMLAHQVNHGVRAQSFPSDPTLLAGLVKEGAADLFDTQAFPGQANPWDVAITSTQEHALWAQARQELSSPGLYQDWMFGNKQMAIPIWAGFTIGYHIAAAYLAHNPTTPPSSLAALSAESILAGSDYNP